MRGWVEGSCVWRLSWVSIMGIDFVNLDWQKTAKSGQLLTSERRTI